LFDVPLNGGQSIPVAIPPGVTSVAANSPKAQAVPRIVVAIATGTIEVSAAEPPNTDWKPLVTGTTPVFPG